MIFLGYKLRIVMPAPLAIDLRQRIIKAYEAGGVTQQQVAERFDVGIASVMRLLARKRATGGLEPKPNVGGRSRRKVSKEGEDLIKRWLRAEPDLTLYELTLRWNEESDVPLSSSSLSRALLRIGWTQKKRWSPRNRIKTASSVTVTPTADGRPVSMLAESSASTRPARQSR